MVRTTLLLATALALSPPAWAGDEPLYEPAPAWVLEAVPQVEPSGPPIILFDDQRRIEQGRLWTYVDRAMRIDNPQMLTAAGTLQAAWLPDKGDLIIHRVTILRGGEEIDLLAQGARFEVLRRERGLEQRMLDGAHTATLPVPGLRVGDVLRLSFTTTVADQALDKEVQTIAVLPPEPFQAGFGRVRLSWPQGSDVRWQANGVEMPQPIVENGFATLEAKLPLAKLPDMPEDAPARYSMPPLLQAGTFADWQEVSQVMAPLYSTEGTIAPGSAVAGKVTAIKAAHAGSLDRAVAALRLVQDEVAYLANGMNGGNYIPQSPAETWEMRYGDCKAKTLLLLAMLRDMGIEAEAALVTTSTGDSLPSILPMAAAFDHVIVRTVIDGTEHWLDGTNAGTSTAVVFEVPPFHHALPLRADGAGLIAMAQRPQSAFDRESALTFDHRAGLDVPMLYTAEWHLNGPAGAPVRAVIGQASEDQIDEFVQNFATAQLGDSRVISGTLSFDSASNSATVRATGLMTSPWRWERGTGTRDFGLPSGNFTFRPDRSRAAWRDIPVALPGPYSERVEITVLLPDAAEGYQLEGREGFAEEIAGVRLERTARKEAERLVIVDSAAWPGGELSPGDAVAERARAVRFGSTELKLRAPANVTRRYAAARSADRSRFAAVEAAYAELIAKDSEDNENYRNRANFRAGTFDRAGALEDLSIVLEREPDADTYFQRSQLNADLNRLEDALADAEAAFELAPSVSAARQRAELLRYFGRQEEAIALLEDQDATGEERRTLSIAISDLNAEIGRKDQGLQRIVELLEQRPGDPDLLNARCWYQATWNYQPEDLVTICTEAVEQADWSAPVLDSRAMGYYRLGRHPEALKDLEAALAASPDQSASLFMRGIVRRAMGDGDGQRDISEALARTPSLERHYALFGITAE